MLRDLSVGCNVKLGAIIPPDLINKAQTTKCEAEKTVL